MEPYYRILVLIILFFFGAILGSFACCQAWRVRLKELGKKSPGKWSVCLACGKRLKTSENIPLLSWLAQRGKCKKCGAKIGISEILSEFTFALALPAVGNVFYDRFADMLAEGNFLKLAMLIATALMLVVSMSIMWILLIYDAKWQKLPTFLLIILNVSAVIYLVLQIISLILDSAEISEIGIHLLKALGGIAILPAPYFLLSTLSHEKLVGSGDWLVALPIALILGHWWLALIALFLANFLGSIFGVFQRVKKGARQIPFGPFLIFAFVIVYALQIWLLKLIVII